MVLNWIESTNYLGAFSFRKALALCNVTNSNTYVFGRSNFENVFAQNLTNLGNLKKKMVIHT
jgi:hypothetical protein